MRTKFGLGLALVLGIAGCTTPSGETALGSSDDGGLSTADAPPSADVVPDSSTPPLSEWPDEIFWWCGDADEICSDAWELIEEGEILVLGDLGIGTPDEAWATHQEIAKLVAGGQLSQARLDDADKAVLNTRPRQRWDRPGCVASFSECRPARIRFRFNSALSNPANPNRMAIMAAVATWNSLADRTGLRWEFHPHLRRRQSGVRFDATGTKCFAKRIGRRPRRYDINLGSSCFAQAVILHEMGHAMGLHHEQERHTANRWVRWFSRNRAGGTRTDVRPHRVGTRGWTAVGPYNAESLMQYWTTDFAQLTGRSPGLFFSHYLNRQTLSRYRTGVVSPPGDSRSKLVAFDSLWNDTIRLGHRGIDLDEVRVVDADLDGVDDLMAQLGDKLVWSSAARSGWRPLVVGGEWISARLHEVHLGEFDDDPGVDALVIHARSWTLFSSDAARPPEEVTRSFRVRDAEVATFSSICRPLSCVLVVRRDGSWALAHSPDLLGPLVEVGSGDMGARDIELVNLNGGVTGARHAVAFVDGTLSFLSFDFSAQPQTGWQPLFAASSPLPRHVHRLEDLRFAHVNRPEATGEPIDIVTWSSGGDATLPDGVTPVARGEAVFLADALGSTATSMSTFEYQAGVPDTPGVPGSGHPAIPVAIDFESDAVMGRFDRSGFASFLTLGYIPQAKEIAESDWGAIMTQYGDGRDVAYLVDRYPLAQFAPCASPVCIRTPPSIHQLHVRTVQLDERIELEAGFMSRGHLVEIPSAPGRSQPVMVVEVTLAVSDASGWNTLTTRTESGLTRDLTVREVFHTSDPGFYRVQMQPVTPPGASGLDVATWFFNAPGAVCGDGVVNPGEECDDGAANSDANPNACRSDCTLPRCGDAVIDSGETCDDAASNSDILPDACRTTCLAAKCGDGVVDSAEACDLGVGNANVADTCRLDCALPRCGDGIRDTAEQCDDGNTSDVDSCRSNCTLNITDCTVTNPLCAI